MNCLDCRRLLMTAPLDRGMNLRHHLDTCETCAREAERAREFEGKLRDSLVTTPQAGLEERILLARLLKRQQVSSRFKRWAMATGLALSLGLSGWFGHGLMNWAPGPSTVSVAVIEHIQDELDVLDKQYPITPEGLGRLLSHFGARLTGDLGRVNYANRCNFMHTKAVHMVLQGKNGPVTVLMMPNSPLERMEQIDGEGFSGIVLPTKYGSLAVITDHPEPVDVLAQRVLRAVSWEI